MKKIFALLLVIVMMMSLATVVSAAESQDATYNKVYTATNEGTTSPEETFTIKYTPVSAKDAATGEDLVNAEGVKVEIPAIADSTVIYAEGAATTAGAKQEITVALQNVQWPYVGIYTYQVTEVAGNTAGVSYDTTPRYLKVTVAYDENTQTYYTAFVTLSLADEDKDGITDGSKTDDIENVYSAGKLNVSKTVTGNMGDQEKYFEVVVTFTSEKPVNAPIYIKNGSKNYDKKIETTEWSGEGPYTAEATIEVKHGDTVTFENIPYNVKYVVAEKSYADVGYKTTYQYNLTGVDGQESSGHLRFKMVQAEQAVGITNNKETVVDTGIAMDTVPFIVMAVVAVLGVVAITAKKRVQE